MPPRTRTTAGRSQTRPRTDEGDADPDFLALSEKRRWAIDRAFERGLAGRRPRRRAVGKGKGKADDDGAGGGFADDDASGGAGAGAGGFINDDEGEDGGGGFVDDAGAGGFLEDDGDGDGGGFLPDDEDQARPTPSAAAPNPSKPSSATKVPLRLIPQLLSLLHLPPDDDVLSVFRSSASGWDDQPSQGALGRTQREGSDMEMGVELKDFRAVCAALMGGEEDEGSFSALESDPEDQHGEEEDDEDAFRLESEDEAESSLSSLSGSDYAGPSRATGGKRGTGKGKRKATDADDDAPRGKRGRRGKKALLAEEGPVRLSAKQKDVVRDIWAMLKPAPPGGDGDAAGGRRRGAAGYVLGREEVKTWVRTLGEMWTEDEITEMVSLFSTQHEARGLSFDDFSQVMLRAGLC